MNNVSRPNFRNCRRDIAPYRQHFGFQQRSVFQQNAQGLSLDEFPRDVSHVSIGHVTIAMLNQPSQVGVRDVPHRSDLALYANVLTAIEVQLQSYNIVRRYTVWPRSSGRPKNCSLTANGNFGTYAVAPTQRGFYICRVKPVDMPVAIHPIYYHVSGKASLRSPFTESGRAVKEYTRE